MSRNWDWPEDIKTPQQEKPKSIWDKDVRVEDLEKMSPEEKAKRFPREYNPEGKPYGDF